MATPLTKEPLAKKQNFASTADSIPAAYIPRYKKKSSGLTSAAEKDPAPATKGARQNQENSAPAVNSNIPVGDGLALLQSFSSRHVPAKHSVTGHYSLLHSYSQFN